MTKAVGEPGGTDAPRRRGRPRSEPVEVELERILDAATAVFARDGFGGARVDDIAREVGLNKAVLYRRVDSKQALYDLALDRALVRLRDAVVSAFDAPPLDSPWATLRSRTSVVFRFAEEHPDMFHLIDSASRVPSGSDRVRAARRATVRQLSEGTRDRFREAGLPSGQAPDIVAAICYAVPTALAVRLEIEPTWDRDAVIDLVTAFTMGGLRYLATDGRDIMAAADRPKPAD